MRSFKAKSRVMAELLEFPEPPSRSQKSAAVRASLADLARADLRLSKSRFKKDLVRLAEVQIYQKPHD
jgi:hypothetical protein